MTRSEDTRHGKDGARGFALTDAVLRIGASLDHVAQGIAPGTRSMSFSATSPRTGRPSIHGWLKGLPDWKFTPTSASWMNTVEEPSRSCPGSD